jgi:hypothetical protein
MFSAELETYLVQSDIVFYRIIVLQNDSSWKILKRFSQFDALVELINREFPNRGLPSLPPKKWGILVDHTDPEFIKDRMKLLSDLLVQILSDQVLRESKIVEQFLTTNISGKLVVDDESASFKMSSSSIVDRKI